MTVRTVLIAALLPFLAACASTGTAGAGAADATPGGAPAAEATSGSERPARFDRDELVNTGGWTLQSATAAGGAEIAELRVPDAAFTLSFSGDGGLGAGGVCNQLRGDYAVSGKRLRARLTVATRMACGGEKDAADRRFSEVMGQSFQVELLQPQPYRLRLTGERGEVLVFQAKPLQL